MAESWIISGDYETKNKGVPVGQTRGRGLRERDSRTPRVTSTSSRAFQEAPLFPTPPPAAAGGYDLMTSGTPRPPDPHQVKLAARSVL